MTDGQMLTYIAGQAIDDGVLSVSCVNYIGTLSNAQGLQRDMFVRCRLLYFSLLVACLSCFQAIQSADVAPGGGGRGGGRGRGGGNGPQQVW